MKEYDDLIVESLASIAHAIKRISAGKTRRGDFNFTQREFSETKEKT